MHASCATSVVPAWSVMIHVLAHAEQIFLQLPEVFNSFESRPVVRKTRSYTSTAQWHWPSGDKLFTDVDQLRSVTSTKCMTKCICRSMSAPVSDAKFLPVEQQQAG